MTPLLSEPALRAARHGTALPGADPEKPIDQWTLEDAQAALAQAAYRAAGTGGYASNRRFVEGDHLQDFDGWVGPRGPKSDEGIERQFTPVDVVNEVLDRIVNALLQSEAGVSFAAVDPIDATKDETGATAQREWAEGMLRIVSAWWDRVRLWERARRATKRSRWSGRGVLWLWFAPGHLVNGRLPTGLTADEAFRRVQLADPEPDEAAVLLDEETQEPFAVVSYTRKGKQRVEVCRVRDGTMTVRRLTEPDTSGNGRRPEDGQNDEQLPVDGVTALPVAEMAAPLLITDAVRRQQKRLNFMESVLNRVIEAAGFTERTVINAMPEGDWLTTKPSDGSQLAERVRDDGIREYLWPKVRTLGSSHTTELQGREYDTDEQGGKGITTPQIVYKEPTDPDYIIRAAQHARATVLRECKQSHVLRASDADISASSQEQSRTDFIDDLTNTKGPLEGMLRDIITAAIQWAAVMSAEVGDFLDQYRVVVNLHVNSGPITPEERAANAAQVKDRLLSRRTAMARNGVEDVEAEVEQIDAEADEQLETEKARAEVADAWMRAGFGAEVALKRAGLEDHEVKELVRSQTDIPSERREDQEDQEDEGEPAEAA